MKLNEKEKLICVRSFCGYERGKKYKFRLDPPGAIYIFYHMQNKVGFRTGNRFWIEPKPEYCVLQQPDYFGEYFITLKEYRKRKLQKINEKR